MAVETAKTTVAVKYVMTSPVVTAKGKEPVTKVAMIMDKHDIGSVIIVDDKDRPAGILTERDIVKRVVAKKRDAKEVKAEEAMSKPLVTIEPEVDIKEAARLMSVRDVKRLGVMYKGKLVGIVSSKDILAVTPELLEVLMEKVRITERPVMPLGGQAVVGYCELCGQWSDSLEEVNGKTICEDCREEEQRSQT